MKVLKAISIYDGEGAYKRQLHKFELAWNRNHKVKFNMKDWLQANFLLIPEESPLVGEFLHEFRRYNKTVGGALKLTVSNRVIWEPTDWKTASVFSFWPIHDVDLVMIPGSPIWMYDPAGYCTKHGGGDSLPMKKYIKALQHLRLETPKKDVSNTPQCITVVSEKALAVIRKSARSRFTAHPAPTSPSRIRRDSCGAVIFEGDVPVAATASERTSSKGSFHLLELHDVAGPLSPRSEVTPCKPCHYCKRVWNVIRRHACHLVEGAIPDSDLFTSTEHTGVQRWGHWMAPTVFITRKLRDALKSAGITGWRAEPCIVVK